MRFTKRTVYFSCACVCLVLIMTGMIGREALAARLRQWRLLPEPEHFTELYFAGYEDRPVEIVEGRPYSVAFTVRSFEQQTTIYHYDLVARPLNAGDELPLAQGEVRMPAKASRTVHAGFLGPKLGGRTALTVRIGYTGASAETGKQTRMVQTIHYWVLPAGFLKEGTPHEAD